ncbi:MAG: hypothetical protein H5T71_09855, partial [Chloroflexi bacterium]|nr:hypothetical protein [Chloroflexota bacterium]
EEKANQEASIMVEELRKKSEERVREFKQLIEKRYQTSKSLLVEKALQLLAGE